MKKLLTCILLTCSTASALTPSRFLDNMASDNDWSVHDIQGCKQIAQSAVESSWPKDPTAPLKYINTYEYLSDTDAKANKSNFDDSEYLEPVIAWRENSGAYARMFTSDATPNYVYNFVLIDTIDDSGFNGESVVCASIFGIRSSK